MRWVIAALVAIGLAVGVVLAWPSGTENPPDTLADATTTTTTSTSLPPGTTSSVTDATTTTADNGETSHVVETVEEAEEILRELWFGWFEGIYNEDEDRIREVVGNPDQVDSAVRQFGRMTFTQQPDRDLLEFTDTEILHSTATCVAIWSNVDATPIVGEINDGVHVFVHDGASWLFISQWAFREDLWQDDCQSQLP